MASLKSNVTSQSGDVIDTSSSGDSFSFSEVSKTVLTKFVDVLEAALILVVTFFIIRWVKSYFEKIETKHEQQKTALNFLERITSGFILVVGVTLALKTVGLDMSLLVSVGLLGLSYGLKDVIKNYVAGILIFFKAPFKIGDIVKIKTYTGKVERMEFQATTLKTFDNRDITIYNSDIMAQSIANYSRYPMRRMEINVQLGYGTDTEKALKIFDKLLDSNPNVLKTPKYKIIFNKFTETSIVVQLKFWVPIPSNMLAIRSLIAMQIHKSFDEESILTPYAKSYESDNDFKPNEGRKNRTKEFYNKPIFADIIASASGTGADINLQEMVPEFVDADEPEDL